MTSITLHIFDNLSPVNPLESVVVRIYNQVGDTFVTQLTSGANGQVTTDIPDDTYWIRFYKKGYAFESKLLIVVDTALTNEWIITAQDLTELPPSGADGICRVSGYIIDGQGAPSHLPIINFLVPKDKRIMGRNIIGTEKVSAQPDKNGYIELELIQGMLYNATMFSISDEVIKAKVPDLQSCNITDLLYPMGKLLSSLQTTATITVGEDTNITVSLGTSSGVSLTDTDLGLSIGSLFKSEVSDSNIKVSLQEDKLVLNAKLAGTYTVSLYGRCKVDYSVDGPTLLGTITVTANDP